MIQSFICYAQFKQMKQQKVMQDKLRRREYEIGLLKSELAAKKRDLSAATKRLYKLETAMVSIQSAGSEVAKECGGMCE
ncbi:unnamed protein product [Protopolystoma xenopodis]|uniref:Uncharacterized protein n=1 Tax=Protopolystoma xenopodis TaxID=117903 RepID=A0A3S5CS63_9PLAT|nr:unnamed protein product [Protopolystoma xenopodis]